MFSSLSVEPVASASLGQVYKGQVRDMYGGGEVAVKVQRPHVQASVALDLHLMRRFAEFCQTFPQVCGTTPCVAALLLDWSCMISGVCETLTCAHKADMLLLGFAYSQRFNPSGCMVSQ